MPETLLEELPMTVAAAPPQALQYPYSRPFEEPDWRRIPAFAKVTQEEWEDAVWQRKNTVKNLRQLEATLGSLLPTSLLESIARDQEQRATMSLLIPPQILNTMNMVDLWQDPVRRYMLPAYEDRNHPWPSHPYASRDSLHETDMWAVEGLIHRYPTKVLAELNTTCPQYCGHCTRMDLIGKDVPQIKKARFTLRSTERYPQILQYVGDNRQIRDIVVSGGDIANLHIDQLVDFVSSLIDIEHVRDIRLASKGLVGLPQHFLQGEVRFGLERLARHARHRSVSLALHTHANHAQQVTPLVGRAARSLLDMGFRDVRNQGVLMRGINDQPQDLGELCFHLLDHAQIMPYYFYMCDMIPNSEHWRLAVHEAQQLQHDIMGYLPGFATPRIVCDVPFVGKRWVDQTAEYNRTLGISYWNKNYRTMLEMDEDTARSYPYWDPIYTLEEEGQAWWREKAREMEGAPC